MTTNVDITNRALALVGTKSQITSMTDGSAEATYANLLYNDIRDFLLRQEDYDFALKITSAASLAPPAGVSGPLPTTGFLLKYPADCVRIRQIYPQAQISLVNDPHPIQWFVFDFSGANYIALSDEPNSVLYTYRAPEDVWDSIFTQAMERMLGSALAFAIENRIEASREMIQQALTFAGVADKRADA